MRGWKARRQAASDRRVAKMQAEIEALPEYGTVAYHQHYVKVWKRSRLQSALILAFQIGMLCWIGDAWYLRLIWGVSVSFGAISVFRTHSSVQEHRQKAWAVETQETVAAMASSGLYTLEEAIRAVQHGPVPPGLKRDEWVAQHEELIRTLREKGLEG